MQECFVQRVHGAPEMYRQMQAFFYERDSEARIQAGQLLLHRQT